MGNENGKFKVVVLADSRNLYASNMLTFETLEDAEIYAKDLFRRWTLVREWAIIPIDLEPDSGSYWSSELIKAKASERSGQ